MGRWISPEPNVYEGGFDSSAGLLAHNVYAYCANNPVNFFDPTGELLLSALIIGVIVGPVIGFAATAYADYQDDGQVFNGSVEAKSYVANTLVGGAIGGFTGGVGSSTFTFAVPTMQMAMTSAGSVALVSGATTVTVSGTAIVSGVVSGLAIAGVQFFSNRSDKEKSSDKPSWVNKGMVDPQKSAQQNATDILNDQYGPGNWKKGANTEYNKIVKWIIRKVFFYGGN